MRGQDPSTLRRGGEPTQGGAVGCGGAMRRNISLPLLSHLKHCIPRSPKETIYRQVFLIFYRECSTPRVGNVASKTQGLVSGEAEKDTIREVRDKPQSKHWVRSWERKSERILSTGALAQLMGRLKKSPLPHSSTAAPFRLKLYF